MKIRQKGFPTKVMAGIIVAVVAIAVGMVIAVLKVGPGSYKEFEVVLNLEIPENDWGRVGSAYLAVPNSDTRSPTELIDKIFELPKTQYSCHLENSAQEGGKIKYLFRAYSNSENWLLEYDTPPIRQDNAGENFCFYTFAKNIVAGGGYSWWDVNGYGSLTVILPENYELRSDILEPVGREGKTTYKDNEYSVFTGAPELTKEFENGRWTIKADFTSLANNEDAECNTDLYLEIHYRYTGLPH